MGDIDEHWENQFKSEVAGEDASLWIGELIETKFRKKKAIQCFRASKDGWLISDFHKKCDG